MNSKMDSKEIESKVKDEVLAVFRFRNQLTRCAKNLSNIGECSMFLDQLACLLKEPVVDSMTREIIHHCRLIVEAMVSYLLRVCNISYSSTLNYQLKWLKKISQIYGMRQCGELHTWVESVFGIKTYLNAASHVTSEYLSISIVLKTIEGVYTLSSRCPAIVQDLTELAKTKQVCRFYVTGECSNKKCTFAH